MAYGPDGLLEDRPTEPEALRDFLAQWPVAWVNVDGLGEEAILRRMGEVFRLHPLTLEDVVNVHQRAKVEPDARRVTD